MSLTNQGLLSVGFFMSLVLGSLSKQFFDNFFIVNLFFDGMLTAGSVWALNAIIEYYENEGK